MLTESQRSGIRLYLGFPDLHRYLNSQLEGIWDGLSLEAEDEIVGILGCIARCNNALIDTALPGAGLKRVDEIWFAESGGQRREIQALGRMYIGRLSTILGVPLNADFFSGRPL